MGDVVVVAVVLTFFGLGLAYVRLCNRIVGPDTEVLPADEVRAPGEGRDQP
jgi:hypothetical protein